MAWDSSMDEQALEGTRVDDLVRHALEREGRCGAWAFGIRFVDDAEIASLHERFMSDPSPTDIITFPYDEDDGDPGGDIVISVETAASNAVEHGWTVEDELGFLVLHGVLHVLGWNDRSEQQRDAMLDRQRDLLATLKSSPSDS